MRRPLLAAAVAAILLFAGAYFASPYFAVHQFRSAAQSGDAGQLEAAVDFPRVRESLKAQFNAAMATRMQSDSSLKADPFAGLAMMMAPAIVDRMVDAAVTPDGIAAIVRAGKVPSEGDRDAKPASDVEVSSSYVALDRFRMKIANRNHADRPIGLIFERQGLFGWRLERIELPMPLGS